MRHALIARRAALMLGAVMLLAACEGSGNGPASPRTSEVVHLSQAPVDAVPYVASRPAPPAPAPETTTLATQDKALTAQAQAEANAPAPMTAASSATVAANTATPVTAPSRSEPGQPQPAGDVPQN